MTLVGTLVAIAVPFAVGVETADGVHGLAALGLLTAALLLAVLAFGAWEWQQSPNGLIASGTTSKRSGHHDDD